MTARFRLSGLGCALLLAASPVFAQTAAGPGSAAPIASAPAARTPPPDPALWVVRGPHATVYLFGTVHALRPDQPWRSAKVDRAFAESGALWEEIDEGDPAGLQPLVLRLGADPAHPLSTRLDAATLARVDATAKAAGMPGGEKALEPMRPWLAGLTLSLLPLLKSGYAVDAGVDKKLKAEARVAGKPLHAFETAEQQLHFFADLPQPMQLAFLRSSLDDAADGPAKLDEMVAAWARGDVPTLARLETDDLKREAPALYDTLIVRRNAAWARTLAEQLRGGEGGGRVIFVAVGAGHLAGPDSLQHALERQGFKAVRR